MRRREALSFLLICTVAFLLPSLWRTLHVPSETVSPAMVRRVIGEGSPPAIGAAHPRVTIVLFTDARCPICRVTEASIAARMRRDPAIRLVVRDWPILGAGSVAAARAALAVADLPAYPRFCLGLAESRRLDAGSIAEIAEASGIDPALIAKREAERAPAIDATLSSTSNLAGLLALPGTPGVLIGDRLVRGGLSGWALDRLIARAR